MKTRFFVMAIAIISLVFNIYLSGQVANLTYERTVFDWKYFTCKTLLDDPAIAKIMETKWAERKEKK